MNEHTINPIIQRLFRLQLLLLLAFFSVFLALIYWGAIRGATIVGREDNPRLVEDQLRIDRGQILDRNRTVLAYSVADENGRFQRIYPQENIGAAVGYYNFRHGTAGAEAAYDDLLSGDDHSATPLWRQELLNEPQKGFDIQLSLDFQLQRASADLLQGFSGALLIFDNHSGEILSLVSLPGYEPNNLEQNFDALVADPTAPLLNRPLQGEFQPGRVLQPFIIAHALDQNLIAMDEPIQNIGLSLPIDGQVEDCVSSPEEPGDWESVLIDRCPYPLFILADKLGADGIQRFYDRFGFTNRTALLETVEERIEQPVNSAGLAAIGQDIMTVTPLQIALAWSALLNEGEFITPLLVTAVQDEYGNWQEVTPIGDFGDATTAFSARSVLTVLQDNDSYLFSTPVLSGPEGETNTWILGAYPLSDPTHFFVLVLENVSDMEAADQISRELFNLIQELD